MTIKSLSINALCLIGIAMAGTSQAQTVYSEDFTKDATTNQWYFSNGACLTAGTGTSLTQPGPVPSCSAVWTSYYSGKDTKLVGGSAGTTTGGVTTTALDPVGSGALRFTNGYPYGYSESGAIVSKDTFSATQGVQITFKAVSYRGDSGGAGGDGADGISFFLMDGSLAPTAPTYNGVGAYGGSLGYSCSNANPPYDGLVGAYVGLGIDEYGNFLNGKTLYPGYTGSNSATSDNSAVGYGYRPNRIGMRGAGNVSWKYLSTTYSSYYPTSTLNTPTLQQSAVQNTCVTGTVLDYSSAAKNYSNCPVGGIASGTASTATFTATVTNNSKTMAVSVVSTGTLTVGQTLSGSGIPGSTTITAVVAGPGGTYTVTMSTKANKNATGAYTATGSGTNPDCPLAVSNATLTSGGKPTFLDYPPIPGAYMELPSTGVGAVTIANESAMARPTGLTTGGVTSGNVFIYNLKITQSGLLSLAYSINGGVNNPVITNQSISTSNGALPASLRFGFAGSTGGSTNIHEIMCFKAQPSDTSASSAATDQQQAGKIQTTSQAYFAYYNPNDWTGRMTAYGLAVDTSGILTINSLANWDSQCVLTGVPNLYPATVPTATCPTTGLTTPSTGQSPTSGRVMLTWNGLDTAASPGTAGIPFEWPPGSSGGITTAQESVLDASDTAPINANRLNFLRGDTTYQSTATVPNTFRQRNGVLGDIVDSSPVWVGEPNAPYSLAFKDRYLSATIDPTPENSYSYASFVTSNQSRANVVYVGANDGFLHAFRTGTEDINGVLSSSIVPNDGLEILAYMPALVLNNIRNSGTPALDYANPQYAHNFYVDATPGTGDLFYGNAWHTWLVGGLGAGGAGIYALDVSNPSSTNFTEANAASLVIGDWSSATISCVNVTSCGNKLGNTFGTPVIRRLHNGMWGVIFGNGFGSTTGDGGIYVMTVDPSTGNKLFYYFSTGTGTAATPNGIAYVTAADLDGDHITDFVYAGDLLGNVWRFDLTSCSPVTPATSASSAGTCSAASGWGAGSVALAKTQGGQPITTPVVLASAKVMGSAPALIVSYGTGQRTQFTTTASTTYVPGTQSLYGVWDWNFGTWNSTSAAQYASLTAAQEAKATGSAGSTAVTLGIGNLQAQTFTPVSTTTAGVTTNTVDTSNTTVTWAQCSSGPITCTGVLGWYANLPGTKEQVVSSPALYQQALLVNTSVPASNSPLSCASTTDAGFTYVISVISGGTFTQTGSSAKASGFLSTSDLTQVGLQTNETGGLTVVNTGVHTTFVLGQLIAPVPGQSPGQVQQIQLPTNVQVNRATWTQLR